MVELLPDPFLINQNGAYLRINSLIFYIDVAWRYVIGNPVSSSAHLCEINISLHQGEMSIECYENLKTLLNIFRLLNYPNNI